MLDGVLFGIVDNGILALCALLGIDIDKKLSGKGVNGALFGAMFGNALSDGLGGLIDFPLWLTFNIVLGCLLVVPVVWVYLKWSEK
jgi:hypothetical protein